MLKTYHFCRYLLTQRHYLYHRFIYFPTWLTSTIASLGHIKVFVFINVVNISKHPVNFGKKQKNAITGTRATQKFEISISEIRAQ